MMLLYNFFITGLGFFALTKVFDSFSIDTIGTGIVAVLLFAVVNTVVKPILSFLSLPITILSLGLFKLVINGAMMYLVAFLVTGFDISSFFTAVLASIFISIFTSIFHKDKE